MNSMEDTHYNNFKNKPRSLTVSMIEHILILQKIFTLEPETIIIENNSLISNELTVKIKTFLEPQKKETKELILNFISNIKQTHCFFTHCAPKENNDNIYEYTKGITHEIFVLNRDIFKTFLKNQYKNIIKFINCPQFNNYEKFIDSILHDKPISFNEINIYDVMTKELPTTFDECKHNLIHNYLINDNRIKYILKAYQTFVLDCCTEVFHLQIPKQHPKSQYCFILKKDFAIFTIYDEKNKDILYHKTQEIKGFCHDNNYSLIFREQIDQETIFGKNLINEQFFHVDNFSTSSPEDFNKTLFLHIKIQKENSDLKNLINKDTTSNCKRL